MKNTTKVSVIIPAHNEEKYVKRCICSIKKSAEQIDGAVEIIVVCNRCTDNTQKIAIENGARIVTNNDRCIAKVRNAGIAAAQGDEIIILKNGKEVARLVSRESSVYFLTDSLTRVLKNDYDDKAIGAKRIKAHEKPC